jgi:hypothetical protein
VPPTETTTTEADVVGLFVRRDKRERMLALLGNPSRRSDFCAALLHDRRSLDPTVLTPLAEHGLTVAHILEQVGAPDDRAHCIGGDGLHDGESATLLELLTDDALRGRDLLVFDEVTRRAYYENHEGESFVLQAKPVAKRG